MKLRDQIKEMVTNICIMAIKGNQNKDWLSLEIDNLMELFDTTCIRVIGDDIDDLPITDVVRDKEELKLEYAKLGGYKEGCNRTKKQQRARLARELDK